MSNDELKTTVNKKGYDFKNAKTLLEKIAAQKLVKKKCKELYSDLITPEITELENAKDKGINNKILEVLENLEPVFTGAYFHYKNLMTLLIKKRW